MRTASIKGFKKVHGDANMQKTLERIGPLSVAVHTSEKFASYKSGIFNEPGCSKKLTHGVSLSFEH
jgi:Papain family cysteine protease